MTRSSHFPIYTLEKTSASSFVKYWSPLYKYKKELLYTGNIGRPLSQQRVHALFEWKNGSRLSASKSASIERNYIARIEDLRNLSVDTSADRFLKEFPRGGAIWRIFWMHCWQHERFPIYDQHVHRAMVFIEEQRVEEIPSLDTTKVRAYVERYLPFHDQFRGHDLRAVDRALWYFGKFLKANYLLL